MGGNGRKGSDAQKEMGKQSTGGEFGVGHRSFSPANGERMGGTFFTMVDGIMAGQCGAVAGAAAAVVGRGG